MGSSEIMPFRETGEHSYHRRAFSHDYYAPFIYHIILKKRKGCGIFGTVEGDARIAPGNAGCAIIRESVLGKTIAKALLHLPYKFPAIRLYQFCVMPDHVHILLQVVYRSGRHLDFYIEALRADIAVRYSKGTGESVEDENIFERGYCDKPLYDNRSLDGLFRYIRENPHRLAMRRQFPYFFQRVRKIEIDDKEYEAYGNLFLFRNPDKVAVKISRKFTPDERQRKKAAWLSAATEGSVLVSPFISPAEKEIRKEAEIIGANIIFITHKVFPERFKPAEHDFELCAKGRLLIISLGFDPATPLSRHICMQMNSFAAKMASADNPTVHGGENVSGKALRLPGFDEGSI